jgi:hypothetical protein
MKRFGTIIVAMTICFTAKANVKEQLSNLGINEYNCWVTIKPNSMQFSYGYQVFAENEKDAVRSLLNKIDATFGGGSHQSLVLKLNRSVAEKITMLIHLKNYQLLNLKLQ